MEIAEITKKEATIAVDGVFDKIKEEVAAGEKVGINHFGTFEKHHRAARKGRNPQTNEEIQIAASDVPRFRASKPFKDEVNGK